MSTYKVKAAFAGSMIALLMAGTVLGHTVSFAVSGNSYKSWKQYGESWSSITLGSSSESVAQSGCAVTSAAMLMVKSGSVTDEQFTPATLVNYLNAHGGFNSNACMDFDKLSDYASGFTYCGKCALVGSQAEKAAKMQQLMEEGYCLMAVVRWGGHFVAVDSVSGSEVTMMDPGSRSSSLFEKYSAAGVTELRLFRGSFSGASDMPAANDAAPTITITENLPAPESVTAEPELPAFVFDAVPAEPAAVPVESPVEMETEIRYEEVQTPVILPIEEPIVPVSVQPSLTESPLV